jgi:SAM-dependent methyltransferase
MAYALGHSPEELERLTFQASVLEPTTQRMLVNAGLRPGMRVLDLGCGPGYVAMLASRLMGNKGYVLGIDMNADAVQLARSRKQAQSYGRNVEFEKCAIENFVADNPFDLVVGRYVLIHQDDPTAIIKRALKCVKSGGTVAFHELCIAAPFAESRPKAKLWDQVAKTIFGVLHAKLPSPDVANRLAVVFMAAGLPFPNMLHERSCGGGPDSQMYRWAAEMMKNIDPKLIPSGITTESLPLSTLEARLRMDSLASGSQLVGPAQICAWAAAR